MEWLRANIGIAALFALIGTLLNAGILLLLNTILPLVMPLQGSDIAIFAGVEFCALLFMILATQWLTEWQKRHGIGG